QRYRGDSQIDDDVVAADDVLIERADHRDPADRRRARQGDDAEARAAHQLRRLPALMEPGIAERGGEAGDQNVERHAGDDLIAVVADAGEPVEKSQGDGDDEAGPEA